MKKLYELKEKLCEELEKYGGKELSAGSLDVIDKLAHATKNLCKVIEAKEEEQYSESMSGGSYRGGSSRAGGSSGRGSYANAGGSYGSYEESSYARGRGRSARRDSMGRYSRDEEMVAQLKELYGMAVDEMQRDSIRKLIEMAESQ